MLGGERSRGIERRRICSGFGFGCWAEAYEGLYMSAGEVSPATPLWEMRRGYRRVRQLHGIRVCYVLSESRSDCVVFLSR